jgi:hypothetical protein
MDKDIFDIKKMLFNDHVATTIPILVDESGYRCILELTGRSPDEIEKILSAEKQKIHYQDESFKSLMTSLAPKEIECQNL